MTGSSVNRSRSLFPEEMEESVGLRPEQDSVRIGRDLEKCHFVQYQGASRGGPIELPGRACGVDVIVELQSEQAGLFLLPVGLRGLEGEPMAFGRGVLGPHGPVATALHMDGTLDIGEFHLARGFQKDGPGLEAVGQRGRILARQKHRF